MRSRSRRPASPLARKTGAARDYYKPAQVVRLAHRKGVYLIGRVVVFQDPYLARDPARPRGADARRRHLGDERRGSRG